MDKAISSCFVRGGTSVVALNSADNRLIAAGQQSKNQQNNFFLVYFIFIEIDFQLFSIERK